MDNATWHRRKATHWHRWQPKYLPPYSPDFNPIEMAFSKLKAALRKAAARTIPELWDVIAEAIETFRRDDCINYFAKAGYDLD